jgi:phospholipid N-methyltransferase
MAEWIDWDHAQAVVECGPGTGAITRELLSRIRSDCRFFAVEIHPGMGEVFQQRYPQVELVQDSVQNLGRICRERRLRHVDCVVSGLPWASFSARAQQEILGAIVGVLPRGGQFVTFAYLQGMLLPAARRFQRLVHDGFSEVSRSRIAWRNFPPAFVYRCRR